MDNSNSSSSCDEAAEKRMKVDDTAAAAIAAEQPDVVAKEGCDDGKKKVSPEESSNCDGEEESPSCLLIVPDGDEDGNVGKNGSPSLVTTSVDNVPTELGGSSSIRCVLPSTSTSAVEETEVEDLKVVFNKKQLAIRISLNKTVGDLKKMIEAQTKVAPALQKVLIKGIQKDEVTLKSLGVGPSTKIMVIGSSFDDVMAVSKPPDKEALAAEEATASKESNNWCSLTQHKKIIDKGVPDDVMPGILGETEPLPEFPLFGMVSSKGSKVRLTLKLEADELWIGTKERTEKISIGTIRNVVSQPITGYEHYHIMAIQLGPTEASRFFVYWVPAQYVESIKDALGV